MLYIAQAVYTDPSGVKTPSQHEFYCFVENDDNAFLLAEAAKAAKNIRGDAKVIAVEPARFEFNKVCKVVVKKKVKDPKVIVSFGKPKHCAMAGFNNRYGGIWDRWFYKEDVNSKAIAAWDYAGLLKTRNNNGDIITLTPNTFWTYAATHSWDLHVVGGFTVDPDDKDWKINIKEKVKEALEEYADAKKRAIEDAVEASFTAVNNKAIRYK